MQIDNTNPVAPSADFRSRWRELAQVFLKWGVLSYGGSAMIGVIQADIQDKRGWLTKERFVEGLALANLLPGATLVQFCIFVGYDRAGWLGGILAGLSFTVPAFFIMLGLTWVYDMFGAMPTMQHAFYGIAPVVLGFLVVAVYRLSKGALKGRLDWVMAVAAAAIVAASPLGIGAALLLAGCAGVAIYGSRLYGSLAAIAVLAVSALTHTPWFAALWAGSVGALFGTPAGAAGPPGLWEVGAFFFKVGALTFGGGFTMLAFVQQQVVEQLHWLTPREFLDGLALGQVTPGPILMVAAYVGYKVAGVAGAALAAATIFLPAFLWMLPVVPVLGYFKRLGWVKDAMRGISAAVIGIIGVALVHLGLHAIPDPLAAAIGIATVALVLWRPIGPLPVMIAGAVLGVARMSLWGV